jgi:hypothetical protein
MNGRQRVKKRRKNEKERKLKKQDATKHNEKKRKGLYGGMP